MALSTRALFLKASYRYKEAVSATTQGLYPDARTIELDTNLSEADAQTFATAYLAAFSPFARIFEVEVSGILPLSDFEGAPPTYTLTLPQYSVAGLSGKAIGYDIDHMAQTTVIRLRVTA
jgi:hypothetical protein